MSEQNDHSTAIVDPGYTPLQIERRDGKLWLPNGTLLIPSIEVGTEGYHLDLFIEYERTFGRGNAKLATHLGEENGLTEELYGADFITEWKELATAYGQAARTPDPQLTQQVIQRFKEYRLKHPNLYHDKAEKEAPIPEKRIKILGDLPRDMSSKPEATASRIKLIRR